MIGPEIPKELLEKKINNSDEIAISDEEDDIGPQIPQHVLQKKREQVTVGPEIPADILQKRNKDKIAISSEKEDIGPQIPQHIFQKKREQMTVGPEIPADILQKGNKDEITMSSEEEDIGPQIPQHVLQKKRENKMSRGSQVSEDVIIMSDEDEEYNIGPQIPHNIIQKKNTTTVESPKQQYSELKEGKQDIVEDPSDYTPELPPDLLEHRRTVKSQPGRRRAPIGPTIPFEVLASTEDDNDIIGPALPTNYDPEEESKYSTIHAIEERARQSREAIENKKAGANKVERPDWMLAPPEVDYLKTATSSRSRQFSNKPVGAVDSTDWTDTPADKDRKSKEARSEKRKAEEPLTYSAIDIQKKRVIEEYNMQTRPLSLLELHQKNKKKSREPKEDVTKRPFDREKDLAAPKMMNSKQKKEMLKQSGQFSDRFGNGRGSFL